ncbi:MAG: uracil-DNA glycosylase, partial [Gemmatimonadales bacterium]
AEERESCANWLAREIDLLPALRVVVALGGFGWDAFLKVLEGKGWEVPRPKPKFGHLARVDLAGEGRRLSLVGSYHPSQQNTFTGRLTEEMFDAVWSEAAGLLSVRQVLPTREYDAET